MPPWKISNKASAMQMTTTKKGNDETDELADEGVENIQGRGLVQLASWFADRHDKYGSFMKRFHKFIVGVLIAEKREKSKR